MLPQSLPQANACASPANRVSASSCSINRIDAARPAQSQKPRESPDSNQPKCAIGSNGVLENDIVATMARLVWRKKNLETFRIAELARARFAQIRDATVPKDKIDYLDLAIGTVIEVDPAVREAAIRAADAQARKELGDAYGLVEIGEIASVDRLMKDLQVQDRLDAMIDRCLKRLLFLRGLKSISSVSTSAPRERLTGPSKAA